MKALDLKTIFHKELDYIYGKEEVESFFFLYLEHYLDVARIQLQLDSEFAIAKPRTEQFFTTLEALKQQKPIQYIIGETEFYGLKLKVSEDVLIPRQETEELVDWIIKSASSYKRNDPLKILDVGTGSGCIAISLAKKFSEANVYALDVSQKAIKIARENAESNNTKISFLEADILDSTSWNSEFKDLEFDIIVSNPPYVRNLEKVDIQSNVIDNEPHLALFVDDDNPLVFYKAITDFAVNNLKQKGQLYFEINQYLGNETKQLLIDANFDNVELRKDLNGNDRMLKGIN
ncbi:peptide chain release factor N(5)-glutamine methyltransferase [Winogradskyella haliclonae]|uniref:Release factor glutamine methyltransferase n=1 Tax=Winogradskyella haliclonae TaxID=2048558 RepID=A0ABQ2C3Z4_9FLAO|nr:peptide chain release factor N(5)-glutamine methyltransferase [Winogradskyella haliclonae]GGI58413.1 release factor glutamine methyltransferase [Winogradskyella haliclonae]